MVILDDFDAVRSELYKTQLNHITRPIILSLSKATRLLASVSLDIIPNNPGLQVRSVNVIKKNEQIELHRRF